MKKLISLLLVSMMLLSLCACAKAETSNQADQAAAETTAPAEKGTFQVGFGRASTHPTGAIALAGYGGNTVLERTSQGTLDCLYATCVAITDANGRFQYMPAKAAWDYKTADGTIPYEVRSCQFVQGTGEAVAQELVNMLNELAG